MSAACAFRAAPLALMAAVLAAEACAPGGTADSAPAAKEAPVGKASLFVEPQRFDVGVREPSGVAWHPRSKHLFVVGDEGVLVEVDKTGTVVGPPHEVKGNLEDVTVHTPTGNLVILSEAKSELLYYDPVAHVGKAKWALDTETLLGEEGGQGGKRKRSANGFEGLGFREDASQPGGGVFYLARQNPPNAIVGIAFDPERTPSGPLEPQIVSRWPLSKSELRSASFAPALERLLVISKKGLTLVSLDGSAEKTLPLPGEQPEGVCLDDDGTMWVADDRAGALLKFPGALAVLRARPR